MDAKRDIENHPAFMTVENEKLLRKRLKVLKFLNRLDDHIVRHNLTERVDTAGPDKFSHYKECVESVQTDETGIDVVDTCKCCLAGMYRCRALQILDEIHSMVNQNEKDVVFRFSRHGDAKEC